MVLHWLSALDAGLRSDRKGHTVGMELFTADDLERAVRGALEASGDYSEEELHALLFGAQTVANLARSERIRPEGSSFDKPEEALAEKVNIAREKKALSAREKLIKQREREVDKAIKTYAESAVIMPPYRIDGATVFLATDVKLGIVKEDEKPTDEERALFMQTLRDDPVLCDYITEGYNYKGLQSYLKGEYDEERLEPDDNGVYVQGGVHVEFGTDVRVRGA